MPTVVYLVFIVNKLNYHLLSNFSLLLPTKLRTVGLENIRTLL